MWKYISEKVNNNIEFAKPCIDFIEIVYGFHVKHFSYYWSDFKDTFSPIFFTVLEKNRPPLYNGTNSQEVSDKALHTQTEK